MENDNPKTIATVMPQVPKDIADTGLSLSTISDLAIKHVYLRGGLLGKEVAEAMHLPYKDIVESALVFLKDEKFVEIKGGASAMSTEWRYAITGIGRDKFKEIWDRDRYAGPAPVTLNTYISQVKAQSIHGVDVDRTKVEEALKGIILEDYVIDQVGPAIISGTSLFLYGFPGNGKTLISERIASLLGGNIFVPHAIIIDNQIIKVYDPSYHETMPLEDDPQAAVYTGALAGFQKKAVRSDLRWVHSKRPIVISGGELTLSSLDLIYDPEAKYYEAPLQMKSNNGMLLIDDFGRQLVRPRDLLNRWIVPLEKRIDYITLHTGKKVEIPFDQLVVYSTNIKPTELVDEAFLRRLRYKISVNDPTEENYRKIFSDYLASKGMEFSEDAFNYLMDKYYREKKRNLRACHPRDLINQIVEKAKFDRTKPVLDKKAVDYACRGYFVDLEE